ncbi:hypothetical protein [Brachybacterium sp. YJGR34]|uniref:hypothetical protein n=1 Tax=Brachybacterium sp. YJGR34 TaxID=2059911 RepID=UPI0013001BAA|nr:hypothetical protein [Brachybacterium sp. YJGR34]
MTTHPCPVPGCTYLTRPDGHCRRLGCPNRVPDDIIRPARDAALAHWRDLRAHTTKETSHD